ncbi:hypothetical protein ACQ4PT_056222 [Festuca glaucescens]
MDRDPPTTTGKHKRPAVAAVDEVSDADVEEFYAILRRHHRMRDASRRLVSGAGARAGAQAPTRVPAWRPSFSMVDFAQPAPMPAAVPPLRQQQLPVAGNIDHAATASRQHRPRPQRRAGAPGAGHPASRARPGVGTKTTRALCLSMYVYTCTFTRRRGRVLTDDLLITGRYSASQSLACNSVFLKEYNELYLKQFLEHDIFLLAHTEDPYANANPKHDVDDRSLCTKDHRVKLWMGSDGRAQITTNWYDLVKGAHLSVGEMVVFEFDRDDDDVLFIMLVSNVKMGGPVKA